MRRLLLVVLFITPILMQGVSAQEGDEQWFFAEDAENNQIIAYNLDADIVPVMDLDDEQSTRGGWRIDSQTMLLIVEDASDNYSMVVVSPDSASPIPYTFEFSVSAVAYQYPYAVFMPNDPMREATPAVLVNVEAATATTLDAGAAPIIEAFPCCRFSEDGTSLRYVAKIQLDIDDPDIARFELRERNLKTGEERVITTVDSEGLDSGVRVSSWRPDSDGDRWLVGTFQSDEGGRIRSTWMMTLDGAATLIDEINTDAEAIPVYSFHGDLMWTTDALCTVGCLVELYDEQGNEIVSVRAFPEEVIQRINYVGDGYIIAESRETVMRLTPDDTPRVVGYRDYARVNGVRTSPNGRLLPLVDGIDENELYFIYDSLSGEVIYSREWDSSFFIFNTLQGRWIRSNITGRVDDEFRNIYVIADSESGEVVEVDFEFSVVSQILSLDEVIIWERDREAETNQISIYGTGAGTKSLLLEGDYFPLDGPNIGDTLRY